MAIRASAHPLHGARYTHREGRDKKKGCKDKEKKIFKSRTRNEGGERGGGGLKGQA